MIFEVTENYLQGQDSTEVVEWLHGCLINKHFLKCNRACIHYIQSVLAPDACKVDRELLLQGTVFDFSTELSLRLTTIKAESMSMKMLILMSTKPSLLLLENLREFEVYKAIAQAYKKDKQYRNAYTFLFSKIKDPKMVDANQSGGAGDLVNVFKSLDSNSYKGVAKYKVFVLSDRDTDDDSYFDQDKNSLFKFFLGKKSISVTNDDIYVVDQKDGFHWHMWYKRAIENYFSKAQFAQAKISINRTYNPTLAPDYTPVKDQYNNYDKNDLAKLTKGLIQSDYERSLRSFTVSGESLSEFQMFLFKIMKVI